MNKKGSTILPMFLFVLGIFFIIIGLGITVWVFQLINDNLGVDVNVGQVNLKNVTDTTFGAISNALTSRADAIGIIILITMSLLMILNGVFFGNNNKLWIPIDILILIFVFIVSIYVSQTYETFINSSPLISAVFIDELPKTSKFMLNMPTVIGTLGALIMVFTYIAGNREERQGVNVLGY